MRLVSTAAALLTAGAFVGLASQPAHAHDVHVIRNAVAPFFDINFCDINGDGNCNVSDSSEMQRAGLFPPLPPLSPSFDVTGCIGYLTL